MPSLHRERLLPLVEVGSVKFEELCRDVLQLAFPDVTRTSLKRERGQRQFGVDVEGFDALGRTTVVISAKCYRKVEGWHFRPWIEDFRKELDKHWKDKGVTDFVLAVTNDCNHDDINDSARLLAEELHQRGIRFHLWGSMRLTDLVMRDGPQLVDRYFYKGWYEVLSGSFAPGASAASATTPVVPPAPSTIRQEAEELRSVLDQIEVRSQETLEAALEADRAGRSNALREWLADARADSRRWQALTPQTRAKALRSQAVLAMRDGDVEAADALLDEADGVSAPADRSGRAMALTVRGDRAGALGLLNEPVTLREREIKAGLLIEAGDLALAARTLSGVLGGEVSSETLRLRAIIAMLRDERDAALQLSSSAVERTPGAFTPLMTRGAIRLFCALAPGVTPRFSGALEPIHPGLIVEPTAAGRLLDQALADFDALIEGDRRERAEVETWRLGCLLLHPDRRQQAGSECRRLLRRTPIDPILVLWSFAFGHLHAYGKIKKALGDAVRRGEGTPTHLIAWATLSAGVARPDRGLAVVARHQHRFPQAAAFLDGWRLRFGDQSRVAADAYEAAMQSALGGDYEPLVRLLDAPAATAVEIVAGGDFFASRQAWTQLTRIRAAMLRVGTPRVRRLAAVAALHAGDPAGCLGVLSAASGTAPLPTDLIGLRIRANEMLGRHQPVIDDLRAIQSRNGPDPMTARRLREALLKIGALPEFAHEAKRSMAAGELDAMDALSVAVAMRRHDQTLARQALQRAVEEGVDPGTASRAWVVAAELGLSDVQKTIVDAVGHPADGRVIKAFQTFEQLQEFIDEQTETYRARFDEWLRGRAPACAIMLGDLAGFARLYLAEPAERKNQLGETFPMLALSGARRAPQCSPFGDRPLLRMDLSALLLAARLDMLDAVEQRFRIEIAASAPEALIALDEAFDAFDLSRGAALRAAVTPGGSVRVTRDLPKNCVALERDRAAGGGFDEAALRSVAEAAFADGHIDREDLRRLQEIPEGASQSAAWGAPGSATPRLASAFVTRASAPALVGGELLSKLSRSTPIYMLASERDDLLRAVRTLEEDDRIKRAIVALRTRVADRLKLGAWITFEIASSEADGHLEAPSHTRCLLELMWKHGRDPSLVWIEDRAVSHNTLEFSLCVTDVLQSLRRAGLVDEPYVRRRVGDLMAAGYAYLPTEALDVSRKLFDAPTDERGVVETPELAALRTWYAREVERMRHLDLGVYHDQDGRIAGEIRRVLAMDLCYPALEAIWRQEGVAVEAKRSQSEWAWSCLRHVGSIGAVRLAAGDAGGYIAVQLAQALSTPLSAALGHEPLGEDVSQAFVDWIMQFAGAPLERADPDTYQLFVETLAGIVERIADLEGADADDADDAIRERLARRIMILVSRFLDLLPDALSERLLMQGDLRRKIERPSALALILTADVAVPVASFESAVAAASTQPPPAVHPLTLIDGRAAEVEARAEGAGRKISLVVGERRFTLSAEPRAAVDPDVDRRVAAVEQFFDPATAISRDALEAAMKLEPAAARLNRLKDLKARDFHCQLRRIRAQLEETGNLDASDLTPPSAQDMAAYLGSPSLTHAPSRTPGAIGRLGAAVGATRAIERVASSPLSASADVRAEIRALLEQEETQARQAIVTPLEALTRLRAKVAGSADFDELSDLVDELRASLETYADLFAALVGYGAGEVCRRSDWSALEDEIWVELLWAYADQMLRAMAPLIADIRRVTGIFEGLTRRAFIDLAALEQRPAWVRGLTADMTADRLTLGTIMALLDDGAAALGVELLTSLRDLIGQEDGGAWWPKMEVHAPPPVAPAEVWAARDVVPAFMAAGWLPANYGLAKRSHAAIARRILAEAADLDVSRPELWLNLSCLVSLIEVAEVEADVLAQMRVAISPDPVALGLEPEMVGSKMILTAWANILAQLGEVEAMSEVLATFARHCAAKWPQERVRSGPGQTKSAGVLDMISAMAQRHALRLARPRREQLEAMAATMSAVATAWSLAAADVAMRLDAAADLAEAADAVPLRAAATAVRA